MTPELRDGKWEKKDCCVMPVGPLLAKNAEELARHVFRDVVVVSSGDTREQMEATLTPRLVYITRTMGACGPCESIIAIKLEWRVVRPDGRPVWIETVGGQATGTIGGNPEKVLKGAIEDLFLRSERVIVESRAIRYAVGSR